MILWNLCVIIREYAVKMRKKHAMMREVARLERGNFRGVCPILNRAKELGVCEETCEPYVQRRSDSPSGIDCDPSQCRFYNVP